MIVQDWMLKDFARTHPRPSHERRLNPCLENRSGLSIFLLRQNTSLRCNVLVEIAEGERRSVFLQVDSHTTGAKNRRWFIAVKEDFEIFIFDQFSVQDVHCRTIFFEPVIDRTHDKFSRIQFCGKI